MELIAELNPQQQQAVMAGLGPILVLAGPGSGKTRVLTQRIAYLISAMGVRPRNILAVTFTNKAAREMEHRVEGLIGSYTRGLTLGTFHSIYARILRREAEYLPFQSNFVIYDADDQVNLVKRAIQDLNMDDKRYRPASIHHAISNAKNELLLPDSFVADNYREEVVQRIFTRYQELLLESNALDFDDLLLWTAYLLENSPQVRDRYARRYEYVLVDEFQDTNLAQYTLLQHLASFHRNIFVVGDTDQSIYRWRGADYRNVQRFEKDFSDSQVILLEQNYRSTQTILDIAMHVIDRNPYRTPKHLFTDRGAGQKAILHEAYDDTQEAIYIVEAIATSIARANSNPGDFAIMYRTNAQSRLLEEAFLKANLPYKLVGAQRFYGRREIKDIVAYLRLIHNPNDEISLMRAINTPARGIGTKTYVHLRTLAQQAKLPPGRLLLQMGKDPTVGEQLEFASRARKALQRFAHMFYQWENLAEEFPPLALMDRVIEDIQYQSYLDDGTDEGIGRWENVMELRRLADEYKETGLAAFLEQVALVSDQDTLQAGANVPTLLTLHAAKGLEFPIVFIAGLNDGTLPHSRSFEDPEAMMEERRLLYVGITRAKDKIYLSFAQNRSAYGFTEPVDPSRYLQDIPPELVQDIHSSRPFRRSRLEARPERWGVSQKVLEQRFHPGMRVIHPTWGEGMVLNVRLQDDDEIVDIYFEDMGLKRVAASLANLKIRE